MQKVKHAAITSTVLSGSDGEKIFSMLKDGEIEVTFFNKRQFGLVPFPQDPEDCPHITKSMDFSKLLRQRKEKTKNMLKKGAVQVFFGQVKTNEESFLIIK